MRGFINIILCLVLSLEEIVSLNYVLTRIELL